MDNERPVLIGLHAPGQIIDLPYRAIIIDDRTLPVTGAVWFDRQQVPVFRVVMNIKRIPEANLVVRIMFRATILIGEEQAGLVGEIRHLSGIPAAFPTHLALETGLTRNDEMTFGQNSHQVTVRDLDADTGERLCPFLRRSG